MNLHHIGYAVAQIEPAVALYVTRFQFQICTPIIHDRSQTAYVQFVRLPGDNVYLEFVAPDGPGSRLSNAVSNHITLHHLCYVHDDIDQAARDLRKTGMILLGKPVPAVAFNGRRVAWLLTTDRALIELVERGGAGDL